MQDERIEQAKNKIRSEMAVIVFLGVVASFLVKTMIFKMELQECITEYVIMIFFPLYQFIRMHTMKISIYGERRKKQAVKNLIIIVAIIVVISAVSIFNSMSESALYVWPNAVAGVATFLVLFVAIFIIANKFNQHRGHKYEEEFDDDK